MQAITPSKKQSFLTKKVFEVLEKIDRKAGTLCEHSNGTMYIIYDKEAIHKMMQSALPKLTLLIRAGADMNADHAPLEGNDNYTFLTWAITRNQNAFVKRLLQLGADANVAPTIHKLSPLEYALIMNHDKITELLLDYGASVNKKTEHVLQPYNILETALKSCSSAGLQALVSHQNAKDLLGINYSLSNGETALTYLLKGYSNTLNGNTHYSAYENAKRKRDMVEILANAGADFTKPNLSGETPKDLIADLADFELKALVQSCIRAYKRKTNMSNDVSLASVSSQEEKGI